MERALYSQRVGRGRDLSVRDFVRLVWQRAIIPARTQGLFAEALEGHVKIVSEDERVSYPPRVQDADSYFLQHLRSSQIGRSGVLYAQLPASGFTPDEDVVLDLLELLHAECVSEPASLYVEITNTVLSEGPFDQANGQRRFRDRLNPILAQHTPPLEMRPNGHIVQRPPADMQPLIDEPLPDNLAPDLRDPIRNGIERFYGRGAADTDRLDAVRHLADALERLRPTIKAELLKADDGALFQIANQFRIRHNNLQQRRDYDTGVWLEWIFHVYLATARMMIRVQQAQHDEAA